MEITQFQTPPKPIASDVISAICQNNNYTIVDILSAFKIEDQSATVNITNGGTTNIATATGFNANTWPSNPQRVLNVQVVTDGFVSQAGLRYNIDLNTGIVTWLFNQPGADVVFKIFWFDLA